MKAEKTNASFICIYITNLLILYGWEISKTPPKFINYRSHRFCFSLKHCFSLSIAMKYPSFEVVEFNITDITVAIVTENIQLSCKNNLVMMLLWGCDLIVIVFMLI